MTAGATAIRSSTRITEPFSRRLHVQAKQYDGPCPAVQIPDLCLCMYDGRTVCIETQKMALPTSLQKSIRPFFLFQNMTDYLLTARIMAVNKIIPVF